MARVTVEDCVTKVPNRFQLVMLASQRARNISAGAEILVERDNDKNPVVALREIAEESDADFRRHRAAEQRRELHIYWGAYLGPPDELLVAGPLAEDLRLAR